jgi:hypothetical protein
LRSCRGGDIANSGGRLYCRDGDHAYDDRYDRRYDDRYYADNRRYRGRRNPCGDDVALGTGLGALGGAGIGAAINRGNDTGAAIGGAILGAIIGNAIARNECDDDRYDAYYYQRGRYDTVYHGRPSRWHNPHTGAYGEFRIRRTYRDYGYWDDGRWYRVDRRSRRDRRYRYAEVTCREYVEIYRGRRGRLYEETHVVCSDGSSWRYVS